MLADEARSLPLSKKTRLTICHFASAKCIRLWRMRCVCQFAEANWQMAKPSLRLSAEKKTLAIVKSRNLRL
jgi:hypothetical protein